MNTPDFTALTEQATVFIVDDDSADRKSLQSLVKSVGLRVETFGSAERFLAGYDPVRPGCLVLEVRMPGMSGLDLQDHLCQHGLSIPIVMVTAHADVTMAVRAMKSGAVDFLQKPVNEQHFVERMQSGREARSRKAGAACQDRQNPAAG